MLITRPRTRSSTVSWMSLFVPEMTSRYAAPNRNIRISPVAYDRTAPNSTRATPTVTAARAITRRPIRLPSRPSVRAPATDPTPRAAASDP